MAARGEIHSFPSHSFPSFFVISRHLVDDEAGISPSRQMERKEGGGVGVDCVIGQVDEFGFKKEWR
jgi:hypothetical protein